MEEEGDCYFGCLVGWGGWVGGCEGKEGEECGYEGGGMYFWVDMLEVGWFEVRVNFGFRGRRMVEAGMDYEQWGCKYYYSLSRF